MPQICATLKICHSGWFPWMESTFVQDRSVKATRRLLFERPQHVNIMKRIYVVIAYENPPAVFIYFMYFHAQECFHRTKSEISKASSNVQLIIRPNGADYLQNIAGARLIHFWGYTYETYSKSYWSLIAEFYLVCLKYFHATFLPQKGPQGGKHQNMKKLKQH